MKKFLIGLTALAMPFLASADILGIYETEKTDKGDYAKVQMANCGESICGTIIWSSAKDSKVVGMQIVWDMKPAGENAWKHGKIKDPVKNKTYNSKMSLEGDNLKVSGCVLGICRAQTWKRSK